MSLIEICRGGGVAPMLVENGPVRLPKAFGRAELVVLLFASVPLYLALAGALQWLLSVVTHRTGYRTDLAMVRLSAVLLVPLMVFTAALSLILTRRYVAARCMLLAISLFGLLGLVANAGFVQHPVLRITSICAAAVVVVFNLRKVRKTS